MLALTALVRRHRTLATIAVFVSAGLPVVGLLLTVIGLTAAFRSNARLDPAEKAAALSEAIAEAMNSTAFGLAALVPCLALSLVALARAPRRTPAITSTPPPQ
jgi:biopolymer transport protein ExbB/TolQ